MLTSLPAVTVLLTENGHPGFVVVASRVGMEAGAVVDLHSSAVNHLSLKVQKIDGLKVYLWDPVAEVAFNASAFLTSDGANLVQAAQDLFGGLIRDFFVDPEEDQTPLATPELAAILTDLLPGGAGAASNVSVINFPAQQHVIVDNQVSFQLGSTQNTGTLTASGQTVALPLLGSAGAAIVVTGSWTGTITFEASADAGATWFAVDSVNPDAANEKSSSTTTGNGTFQPLRLQGCTHIRARASAAMTGTANISLSGTNTTSDPGTPSIGEPGTLIPTYAELVGGSDGTDLRAFSVDSSGRVNVNIIGTVPVSAVSLPLPTGAATAANQTNGAQITQVSNFPVTQPISAVSLPLPTGAATQTTLASILTAVTGTLTVGGTVNVGNFPATQPVSAVSWPLPTGASTSANQTNGSQITQLTGWTQVDPNNSTSAPLGAGATFTGTATNTVGFSSVVGYIFTDQPGTLQMEESSDGTNWDIIGVAPIGATPAGGALVMGTMFTAQFYRILFTCGATPQGAFRFQSILTKTPVAGDITTVGGFIAPGQKGQIVKAVISGKQPSSEGATYKEVAVDNQGAMLVSEATAHATFGEFLVTSEKATSVFKAVYGINSRTCNIATLNGGTVTWNAARANLQTSAATNGSAKLATREAVRYVPGTGNIARGAPVFSTPATSSRQAWGFLTDTDGFGFGYNGTQFGVLIRNNSVDTWIPQSSWNGNDKFDGTGSTGNVLNPQRGSPMQIQMQWLGFGAVRWYIEDPNTGDFILVHILKFANTSITPSIQQPSLPVRMEVVNTGNGTNLSAFIASMGGYAEGDSDIPTAEVRNSFSQVVTGVPTTGAYVFSVRNKVSNVFGGTNINAINVHIDFFAARNASGAQDAYFQLVLNPTLAGVSYADIDTNTSVVQSDIAGSFVSGGIILMTVPIAAGSTITQGLLEFNIRLAPGDVLMVRAFSETATVGVRASLSWHEEN